MEQCILKAKEMNLESEIAALIASYVNNGDYSIKLKEYDYGADGYCNGAVIIGGLRFNCSFHKRGFICWFNDISNVLRDNEWLNKKICKEVNIQVKEHEKEIKEQRIKELEKELKELKGE